MTNPRPWVKPLDVKEVSARLGVSKMTVYRLIEDGDLGAYRIGRQLRVTHAQLSRFLQSASDPYGDGDQ